MGMIHDRGEGQSIAEEKLLVGSLRLGNAGLLAADFLPSDRRPLYTPAEMACGCGKKKAKPIARRGFTASAGSTDPNRPNAIDRAARIKADKQRRLNGI